MSDDGYKCLDCGIPYDDCMAISLLIPRAQWLLIHPADDGLLCANCMLRRAEKLPGAVNITGQITFGDDSFECYKKISGDIKQTENTPKGVPNR